MNAVALAADLAYLRDHAFEFTLEVNPHAACFTPVDDWHANGQHDPGFDADDWLSREDYDAALRTGSFVHGQVYPNGSVSSFSISGQDLAAVVFEMAQACRKDQAEWRAQGLKPMRPKP